MPFLNIADNILLGTTPVNGIFVGDVRVWPPAQAGQPQVSSVSSAGTLTLTWSETTFADLYEIRRNGALIATQASRVYNDSGLEWGVSYSYTITPIVFDLPGDESVPSIAVTIPKGTVGTLTPSSRSYTNVTVSWAAVAGADQYKVYRNGSLYSTQTALSKAIATSEDSTISIYVVPVRNGVEGNASETKSYYSGRSEQRDTGSKSGMVFNPNKVDSWRSADDWAWLSNTAAQGYFTSSYGSYRGVIYYGSDGVRGELRGKLGGNGTDRQSKGSCTKAELYLYKKSGIGSGGSVTVGIQRTNNTAGGGAPSGTGNVNKATASGGSGSWINIGTSHGQALGDGTYKSLMTRRDGSGDYAQFTDCRLRLSWSWNYVTESAKSDTWT